MKVFHDWQKYFFIKIKKIDIYFLKKKKITGYDLKSGKKTRWT